MAKAKGELKAVTKTIKQAKKKTWEQFSRYTRLRYADKNGICTCVTCGVKRPWKQMQAGHALAGRGNSILFHENLVFPQCYGCNCCASGRLDVFQKFLIDKYGLKEWEKLYALKNKVVKYCVEDLTALKDHYKRQADQLEAKYGKS